MANRAQKIANAAVRNAGGRRGLGKNHFTAVPAVKKLKKEEKKAAKKKS